MGLGAVHDESVIEVHTHYRKAARKDGFDSDTRLQADVYKVMNCACIKL